MNVGKKDRALRTRHPEGPAYLHCGPLFSLEFSCQRALASRCSGRPAKRRRTLLKSVMVDKMGESLPLMGVILPFLTPNTRRCTVRAPTGTAPRRLFDRRWTGPGRWRLLAARPSNSDLTRGSRRLTGRFCVATGGLRHLTRWSCIAPRRSGHLTGGSSNPTRRSGIAIHRSGHLTRGSALLTGGSRLLTGGSCLLTGRSDHGWASTKGRNVQ